MQILTMSFRIMLLSEKYQPRVIQVPMIKLSNYWTLNQKVPMGNRTCINGLYRNRKISQLAQIPMHRMPNTKLSMQRHTQMPVCERAAITIPMRKRTIQTPSKQQLIQIALPPNDHGLEYIATMAIRMVIKNISTIKPHSSVFGEQLSLQYIKQERVVLNDPEDTCNQIMSKQFWQLIGQWQLLKIVRVHDGGLHVLFERVGERRLYLVPNMIVVGRLVDTISDVGALLLSDAGVCKYVQMGDKEQSKKGLVRMNSD